MVNMRTSLKQTIGDNCAAIALVLGVLKRIKVNDSDIQNKEKTVEIIDSAVAEMREAINLLPVSVGYLIIENGITHIASMITDQMINKSLSNPNNFKIIRMIDGKILKEDLFSNSYDWVSLGIYN